MAIRRNGLKALTADIVYKGEPFKCSKGATHSIEHELNLDIPRTKDNIYAFYAVAVYPDGTQIVEVMSLAEVEHVRATYSPKAKSKKPSESWQIDAWRDSYGQMGRKTVIKRLCKHLNREKNDDDWLKKLPQSTQEEEADEGQVYCQTDVAHDEHTEYEIVQTEPEQDEKEIINPVSPIVKKLNTKPLADKPTFNTGNLNRDLLHAYSRAIQEKLISSMEIKNFLNHHGVKDLNDISQDAMEIELDRLNALFAEVYCDSPAMINYEPDKN
jgi:recombinational DNA repair protein RecT